MGLKQNIARAFHWTLADIDDTDFLNLCAFLNTSDYDSGTKVIKGKVYKRSDKAPPWLN